MDFTVADNPDKRRFEAEVAKNMVFIDYIRAKDAVFLNHTEVPPVLEGQGIGAELMRQTLEKLKTDGDLLAPLCPFVAAYLKRHPQWKFLLARGYNV